MNTPTDASAEARHRPRYVAFLGGVRIASGDLAVVAVAAGGAQRRGDAGVAVFDRDTGKVVDLDLRGTDEEIALRHAPAPALAPGPPPGRGRGRPKLGVVAREVTLLPRHWDWLARQPGGASTALRRLVEAARGADAGATDTRERREAAYRFMAALAGDLPGFEEGTRALFAGDRPRLAQAMAPWPADLRDEVLGLLAPVSRSPG